MLYGMTSSNTRLQLFVAQVGLAVEASGDEPRLLQRVRAAMRELVAVDDWLPDDCARPHPQFYQQYLLYRDPADRFSVVSFVWGPGQKTPVHDHTVWGVIGVLRGSETAQHYRVVPGALVPQGPLEILREGDVTAVSPSIGDVHQVSNAFPDRVSISIHAYGADIGQLPRHVFDPVTGAARPFVSGYATHPG